jgi:hypothetical protein
MNFRRLQYFSWKNFSTLWGGLTNFFKLLPPGRVLCSISSDLIRPQISLETYICQQHMKKLLLKSFQCWPWFYQLRGQNFRRQTQKAQKGAYRRYRPEVKAILSKRKNVLNLREKLKKICPYSAINFGTKTKCSAIFLCMIWKYDSRPLIWCI